MSFYEIIFGEHWGLLGGIIKENICWRKEEEGRRSGNDECNVENEARRKHGEKE